MTRRPHLLLVLLAAAGAAGCDSLECRDLRIDLVNDVRNGPPLNMTLNDDVYSDSNLVLPGARRQVKECLDRGDATRIRVGQDGITLFIANCVTTRNPEEYEAIVSRVLWDGHQLVCENW